MQFTHLKPEEPQMLPEHAQRLAEVGAVLLKSENSSETCLAEIIYSLAMSLGSLAPGRTGESIERLVPYDRDAARPPSLSAIHGLAPFPLHTDTAYWYRPARYIILGCSAVGDWAVPTILFDHEQLPILNESKSLLQSAPFKIANGRRSFYAPILDRNLAFFRYDRDCMAPATPSASQIVHELSRQLSPEGTYQHFWQAGDIMIVDNWRLLHGRGTDAQVPKNRVLLRATIK